MNLIEKFDKILLQNDFNKDKKRIIGELSEKTLHHLIKNLFEDDITKQEVKINNYYADIYRDNEVIEIQTKQFNKLRDKLDFFLNDLKLNVHLVYPMFNDIYLYWVEKDTNKVIKGNKSPKKFNIIYAFYELYKIKNYLKHDNFTFSILVFDIDMYRYLNGYSKDLKRGTKCMDKIPKSLRYVYTFNNPSDYLLCLPDTLLETFTVKDIVKLSNVGSKYVYYMLNVLTSLDVLEVFGKSGRMNLYKVKK